MRKEIYYNDDDALKRAQEFAIEHNGFIDKRCAMVDHHMHFDYIDDAMLDLCWSGECCAYRVRDNETCADIGVFGYWQ